MHTVDIIKTRFSEIDPAASDSAVILNGVSVSTAVELM